MKKKRSKIKLVFWAVFFLSIIILANRGFLSANKKALAISKGDLIELKIGEYNKIGNKFNTIVYSYDKDKKEQEYYVSKEPILTSKDVDKLIIQEGAYERFYVEIIFKKNVWEKLQNITEKNIGKPLLFISNNKIIHAPRIAAPIINGKAGITSELKKEEAEKLVRKFGFTPNYKLIPETQKLKNKSKTEEEETWYTIEKTLHFYKKTDYCQKAIQLYHQFIKKYPKSKQVIIAYDKIATNHLMLQEYNKAIEAYKEVLKLDKENKRAIYAMMQIANIYNLLNQKNDVEKMIDKTIELLKRQKEKNEINDYNYYLNLGKSYESLKDFDKAILTYREWLAIKHSPKEESEITLMIANALENSDKTKEALLEYKKLVGKNYMPDYIDEKIEELSKSIKDFKDNQN